MTILFVMATYWFTTVNFNDAAACEKAATQLRHATEHAINNTVIVCVDIKR